MGNSYLNFENNDSPYWSMTPDDYRRNYIMEDSSNYGSLISYYVNDNIGIRPVINRPVR